MEVCEENSKKIKKEKPGIVYLSRIPRRMNVKQIRHVFGSFGEVGRVFLKPVGEFEISSSETGEHETLTHCAWPVEGRSDLHKERSSVAKWQALMGRPISSSTCWSQVLRARPGGNFQSVAGGVPVKASVDRCNICETGVSMDNRQMLPKSEWRRSAIREGGRSVIQVSHLLWCWWPISVPGYGIEIACEMTGPCYCQFFSSSMFQNHITPSTAQLRVN